MKQFSLALVFVALVGAAALASGPASNGKFMPVEEVRAGMKGHGFSVFQGNKPERFEVEILGQLQGFNNPRQSIIIARLSGPLVDRTSVFAGMSGSPVYIDGKLIGAVAYAFPFAKEPIAGIQPIQYMIDIFERGAEEGKRVGQRLSFNTLTATTSDPNAPAAPTARVSPSAAANPAMVPYIGQTIVPIATPVTFSGVPQAVVDMFAEDLKKIGLQPMAGLGGGTSMGPMVAADETTLAPGTSVSVQLTRGDVNIAAAGTVTYRDGDRIYAFGHPFLGSGQTSWPMAESGVVTVVPNLNNSFKLSTSGNLVGAISQDRSTGVFGKLGEKPRMVPVEMKVLTSRNKTESYNFEMVSDSFLTPLLMKIAMVSAISATEREVGNHTVKLRGRIIVDGQPDVVLDNSFSMPGGAVIFA
ncbi:MAG TPA: SpoIVB peptidase S55 domain-containing protein, partial [Blastocatellia bacterium]|nr:SpoIVB peptidase S55 domain-containing protein [Blastocatellia bacterium]